MDTVKLNDNAISHIAKLVQVAILTGTDIVDNLRMAEFVNSDGKLDVSPEYHEFFNENIQKMMAEASEAMAVTAQNSQPVEESIGIGPDGREWVSVALSPNAITRVENPNKIKE